MAATQGLLLLYNSTIGAVQQLQCLLLSYNNTIVAAEQARIWPGNIESGTNGVGKPPFGLKLCVVRAVHLRMPPACLDCQKTKKSVKKTGVLAIFGPQAPSGPISALFPGVGLSRHVRHVGDYPDMSEATLICQKATPTFREATPTF